MRSKIYCHVQFEQCHMRSHHTSERHHTALANTVCMEPQVLQRSATATLARRLRQQSSSQRHSARVAKEVLTGIQLGE